MLEKYVQEMKERYNGAGSNNAYASAVIALGSAMAGKPAGSICVDTEAVSDIPVIAAIVSVTSDITSIPLDNILHDSNYMRGNEYVSSLLSCAKAFMSWRGLPSMKYDDFYFAYRVAKYNLAKKQEFSVQQVASSERLKQELITLYQSNEGLDRAAGMIAAYSLASSSSVSLLSHNYFEVKKCLDSPSIDALFSIALSFTDAALPELFDAMNSFPIDAEPAALLVLGTAYIAMKEKKATKRKEKLKKRK